MSRYHNLSLNFESCVEEILAHSCGPISFKPVHRCSAKMVRAVLKLEPGYAIEIEIYTMQM
jgi:hypothetical protein